MKVRWNMDSEDSVALGISYTEIGRIPHDLGTSIICEADMVEPNDLRIKSANGEYKPETYIYKATNGLEVYSWELI